MLKIETRLLIRDKMSKGVKFDRLVKMSSVSAFLDLSTSERLNLEPETSRSSRFGSI